MSLPCTLDAELLEKCRGDDGFGRGVGVWVDECSTDDADGDDGEAATEGLRGVADECAAGHGAQVCDDLGDCDCVGAEEVLVREHGRSDREFDCFVDIFAVNLVDSTINKYTSS